MTREENIKADLTSKFGLSEEKCKVTRVRRIHVETDAANFPAILEHAYKNHQFIILCTITGIDTGVVYDVIYHLAAEDGIMINLTLKVPKENAVIQSVIPTYNGAVYYERELVDLLGIKVEGLPPGNRYPLPDSWPEGQYPLRKDWKPAGSAGDVKADGAQAETAETAEKS
jgi:Ni,Fe-hydrogenase III component G